MDLSRIDLPLSDTEQDFLLTCVSAVIRHQLEKPLPESFAFLKSCPLRESSVMEAIAAHAATFAPRLLTPCGAFVTLHRRVGERSLLRGCIGLMEAVLPLALTVARMAGAAAFSDHRFLPLKAEELSSVEADISLLGPLSPCMPQDIRLGQHGIRLEHAGRAAVFLPEVPLEQGWTLPQTLQALCRKAGLSPRAAAPEAFERQSSRLYLYETLLLGPRPL